MLSVGAMGSGQANYYLELAREDYYLKGGEPPGQWWGQGAAALGLSGQVGKSAFRNLLRGISPDGDRALIQNAGAKDHQPGWDLTFSVPKSVSTLWAVAPDAISQRIREAHERAVAAALDYLQNEAALTRRGKWGLIREPTFLVAAVFEHGTSRAQDPQLHSHALLLNVGVRADGTTGTILSKPLYDHKMAAGALYRAELGFALQQTLGLVLEPTQHAFEVAGVSPQLISEFSKRREAIEKHLAERGTSGAKAAEVAALQTRDAKEHRARAELFSEWQETGRSYGLAPESVQELCGTPAPMVTPGDRTAALDMALKTITDSQSAFTKRDLTRRLAEGLQTGGWGAMGVRQMVDQALADAPEIVHLGVGKHGEPYFTTREMLDLEQHLLGTAAATRSDRRHLATEAALQSALGQYRDLGDEQRRALEHITLKEGGIQLVSGMAGTGKTTLLAAARDAWEQSGYRVYGAALSGKAAAGLEQGAGIQSHTLAKWFKDFDAGVGDAVKHHAKQLVRAAVGMPTYAYTPLELDSRSILVVDEAGMVGTRQMAALVDEVQKAGAKLVLVGDARQLQPIEAGGPFKALVEALGAAALSVIQRQREVWAQEAVHNFAQGKAQEALQAYAERGLLTVTDTRHQAKEALLKDWFADRQSKPAERLILAPTNQEASDLNSRIQQARKQAGELGTLWLSEGDERFYSGDRVLFGQNHRLLGVQNGSLGTVEKINVLDRALTVALDTGERRTIPLNRYKDITLGYAVTTHKAQGATAESAYVLAGGTMQDRELSYVQASRARGTTRFYAERAEVGNPIADLVGQMARSRQKELAVTLLERQPEEVTPASIPDIPMPRTREKQPDLAPSRRPSRDPGYGY